MVNTITDFQVQSSDHKVKKPKECSYHVKVFLL